VTRSLVLGNPLVTLEEGTPFIPNGALIVEDGRVLRSGPSAELRDQGPFDLVLGSAEHFVVPGFVNGHFHSEAALGPGLYELLFERANIWVHPAFKPIDPQDAYDTILVTLMQALRGGQTCAVDAFYGRPGLENFGAEVALQAYQDLGMRAALGMTLRDQNIYVHGENEAFLARLPADLAAEVRASPMGYALPVDDVIAAYERVVARWDGRGGRIRVLLAPDWTPACSNELYQRCRKVATDLGTGIMTHTLETRQEMQFNIRRYGMTAMERLARLGVLGPDVSHSHFVWATDRDIELLADYGGVAVNDPGSNLRLSTGICRVRDIMDASGRIAFGTDAISFSERDDMFQEVRLATHLQRLPLGLEVGRLDSEAVLRAAAGNGARAARAEDRLGSLAPGKDADLIVLRRDRVFWPEKRWSVTPVLDVILDRCDASDIDSVMVAGEPVLHGGVITRVNEQAVKDRFALAVDRGLYELSGEWARWGELSALVEPYVIDFYRDWLPEEITSRYAYNTATGPAGFAGGTARGETK
jgi:5-methylthioadenosine/S-adenosylhomocysteine deaminase